MASLRALILDHENTHWTEARAAIVQLRTQTALEQLTALPGTSPILAEYEKVRVAYVQAIDRANNDVDTTLLPVAPNAPACDMRK